MQTINLKKMLTLLLALVLLIGILAGCRAEPLVIKDSDTYIVVKTTGEKEEMYLVDYMEKLKEKGQLEFEIRDGMIVSINGIDNPVDFSSCWMLYTSDEECSNSAWGTIEYQGKLYGSAISGAETLKIKVDQLYIWVYKSF